MKHPSGNFEGVLLQNGEIGSIAGSNASLAEFLEAGFSAEGGEAVKRFLSDCRNPAFTMGSDRRCCDPSDCSYIRA